jgi:(1->4)-alpha-D-glucan 1-alpha-D-glucosylmutase
MVKSLREAKVHSNWVTPDEAYENAVLAFVRRALDSSRSNPFLESFSQFLGKVAPLGVANSLAQTALKLTVPGVPDIYQGAELWDFNLVDPDNRRPVDYVTRTKLLNQSDRETPLAELVKAWQDGQIKQHVIRELLLLRARVPELFSLGSYEVIEPIGPASGALCAFMRRREGLSLVVVASLYPHHAATETWHGTAINVDPTGEWFNLFDGGKSFIERQRLFVDEILTAMPVAVLFSPGTN